MFKGPHKYSDLQIARSLCVSGAILLASVLIHRLWISNYLSHKTAEVARDELIKSWQSADAASSILKNSTAIISPAELTSIEKLNHQKGFALLYIPRIRNEVWGVPIFEGVESKQLRSGVGHYPQSQTLGEEGNFSLFGHRTSYVQPFSNIQKLRIGDRVIVETKDFWFVYNLKFDRIVKPNATWVTEILRYPELELKEDESYNVVTLITCEPRFSTAKRWVWWGVLQTVYPHNSPPPALKIRTNLSNP